MRYFLKWIIGGLQDLMLWERIHLPIFYLFAVVWHVSTFRYGANTGFLKKFDWSVQILAVHKLSFVEGVPMASSFFLTLSGKLSIQVNREWPAGATVLWSSWDLSRRKCILQKPAVHYAGFSAFSSWNQPVSSSAPF